MRGEGRGGEWALLVFGPFRRPWSSPCHEEDPKPSKEVWGSAVSMFCTF